MERMVVRALIGAGLVVVSVLLGLAAIGLFLTAVYLAVAPLGQPWLAPALTGGVALLVSLVALALLATGRRRRQTPSPSAAERATRVPLALSQSLGEDVGLWFLTHKKQAVVAALAAGFAFGVSPRLRETVRRFLGN